MELPVATDGLIAMRNLDSARHQSWSRFWQMPLRPGIAELIIEQEQLTAQFSGDLEAFDRMEVLVSELEAVAPNTGQTALITAQVACATHRFEQARVALAQAVAAGELADATDRLELAIDQAMGTDLPAVLKARRERAAQAGQWSELIPLGALLADLGEIEESERVYMQALREYPDVSPFALAWLCFQMGMLWGETASEPQPERAARWYRYAIDYLPGYAKARVHLSEIYLDQGRGAEAEALLKPARDCGDPEVTWRLADVAIAAGDSVKAETYLVAARAGFEALLSKHLLAFADHGAAFYAGSGDNPARAFELAKVNLINRPTLRAYEQSYDTACMAGEVKAATQLRADARRCWGQLKAFQSSSLATDAIPAMG